MKVFVDTAYLIAILNPADELAESAEGAQQQLGDAQLLTTDEVLIEFLNAVSKAGPWLRSGAYQMVVKILSSPKIDVAAQSRESFVRGIALYAQRQDKGFSLTDCISMNRMREFQVREVLPRDHHFRQEGFRPLL